MIQFSTRRREDILVANKKDLDAFTRDDQALYDRLVVNDAKIDGMIKAITEVKIKKIL